MINRNGLGGVGVKINVDDRNGKVLVSYFYS